MQTICRVRVACVLGAFLYLFLKKVNFIIYKIGFYDTYITQYSSELLYKVAFSRIVSTCCIIQYMYYIKIIFLVFIKLVFFKFITLSLTRCYSFLSPRARLFASPHSFSNLVSSPPFLSLFCCVLLLLELAFIPSHLCARNFSSQIIHSRTRFHLF